MKPSSRAASRRNPGYDARGSTKAMVSAVLFLRSIQAAGALQLLLAASCAPMPPAATEAGRYLVYFNEFSANLSADARKMVADAAAKAREIGARTVRIEGRA